MSLRLMKMHVFACVVALGLAPAAAAAQNVAVGTEGGIEVARFDGSAWFEFGGRVMVDGGFYAEDEVTLGDGTELRRATFDAAGGVSADWEFEFSADFADGAADINDAVLIYGGSSMATLAIGQHKAPFSIEEMTSSKRITFLERALVNELVPGRRIGISGKHEARLWTASAGVYGSAFDDDADDEGNEAWSVVGRATFVPVSDDKHAVHFGAQVAKETPDDERKVRFNARPESHVTDVKYLDTGKIKDVESVLTYGAEAAAVFGPLSLQGEYVTTSVRQLTDEEARAEEDGYSFSGWYVFASYFLTGESRDYDLDKGAFGRVKPYEDRGALEVAARYSTLDLNDRDVEGGEETNITLGLNWYANSHVRMMVNYILVDNDEYADADGDVAGDDDPRILQVRCQVDF